jgi:hypothetical protein
LSELLGEAAREWVQVEVSAVRVLFELLGFLLNGRWSFVVGRSREHGEHC